MRYRIINPITREFYNSILTIAFSNCNFFSVCTFKNYHQKDLSDSYFQFLSSVSRFENDDTNFILPQHYQKGQKFHVYELNKTTKNLIKEVDSIQSWSLPNLPEDLSFYIQNKVWFSSISHEGLYFGTIKSVDAVHQEGVEHLRLFLYNEGVIGLAWCFLDFYIRYKNCQPSLVVNIRLRRLKP